MITGTPDDLMTWNQTTVLKNRGGMCCEELSSIFSFEDRDVDVYDDNDKI